VWGDVGIAPYKLRNLITRNFPRNGPVRPSSVTFGDTFSQREKAFGLHRTKGFSLWEKLAAQRTDEGRGTGAQYSGNPMRTRWHHFTN
jgi:hypothetical protein